MTKDNKPLFPQLLFAVFTIVVTLLTSIINGSLLSLQTIIYFCAVLLSLLYCIKPIKKNKILIYFFYLLLITSSIVTIVNYNSIDLNAEIYYSQQELDEMRLYNIMLVSIFSLLPQILMLIGFFKPKKVFIFLVLVFMSILFCFTTFSTFANFKYYSTIESKVFALSGLIDNIYILLLWFGIAVKQFLPRGHTTENIVNVDKNIFITENSLEDLKSLYDSGAISIEEYNQRKSRIMNNL
ncbi:MAG: SHOCT domain-containing protein [Clostridia bacterium]|nr:SHOCT domain-containing protein [Clostridia bacterium]